jgi:hypothetical protein
MSFTWTQLLPLTLIMNDDDVVQPAATINVLSDDVLLEIFIFYVDEASSVGKWHMLVHVCQRWRHVIFTFPVCLSLKLLCGARTPVRRTLDVWPALPIVVWSVWNQSHYSSAAGSQDPDNTIAALEKHDRVCKIILLDVPRWLLQRVAAAPQEPFTALTYLEIRSVGDWVSVLPDSFLGGSAPRLRSLCLINVPFPALWKLLLSAKDLVSLHLFDIPDSGYIPPETMVTCLSSLTQLESLGLQFRSPRPRPDRSTRRPPTLTRAILPALTSLQFYGVSEYLEDVVARINAPLLHDVGMTFFNQLTFNIPQLPQFVRLAKRLGSPNRAQVTFYGCSVVVRLSSEAGTVDNTQVTLEISCRAIDWQLSSLAQVCTLFVPYFPTLERLDISEGQYPPPHWQDDMENAQWLEILRPFTATKDLHLSEAIQLRMGPALQELSGGRATEVLPMLQCLFLSGFRSKSINKFIAARRLSGRPVDIIT